MSKEIMSKIVNGVENYQSSYYYRSNGEEKEFIMSEEEIEFLNKNYKKVLKEGEAESRWGFSYRLTDCTMNSFYRNPNLYKKFYEDKTLTVEIFQLLYREGIFFNVSDHSKIASDITFPDDVRIMAMRKVEDKETILSLAKDKSAKVRAEAYCLLGIDKNLEAISKDRSKDVRKVGIDYLPFGSPKLKMFLEKEKASENLISLAKKMTRSDLLFVIGKKSRSKWGDARFQQIIRKRIGT